MSKRKDKKEYITIIAFTINFEIKQNSTILFKGEKIMIWKDTEGQWEIILDAGKFCFSTWVMVQ